VGGKYQMNYQQKIKDFEKILNLSDRKIIRFTNEAGGTDIFYDPETKQNKPWGEFKEQPGDDILNIIFQ
jgi:hypothetical protein